MGFHTAIHSDTHATEYLHSKQSYVMDNNHDSTTHPDSCVSYTHTNNGKVQILHGYNRETVVDTRQTQEVSVRLNTCRFQRNVFNTCIPHSYLVELVDVF